MIKKWIKNNINLYSLSFYWNQKRVFYIFGPILYDFQVQFAISFWFFTIGFTRFANEKDFRTEE